MGVGRLAVRRPNHGGAACSRSEEAEGVPGRRAGRAAGRVAGAPGKQSAVQAESERQVEPAPRAGRAAGMPGRQSAGPSGRSLLDGYLAIHASI
ncbi:hypothetical protein E2562_034948 [Oryza meyeriana var. granulata]|uniref:Uncharacterized protein n=1 Tax=Oryza meyeriana var. granulata TaxID=110450 RepID=A0A6G1D999_9ORYZ|nr:hypothetical protein E2562_034948 [Oryza meyeriana var. granulata]